MEDMASPWNEGSSRWAGLKSQHLRMGVRCNLRDELAQPFLWWASHAGWGPSWAGQGSLPSPWRYTGALHLLSRSSWITVGFL